ncbi:MAG: hypothetical protein EBV72_11265 [Betaproteobacteria bacterium]|nr:hypothetical protein [Betaproteobacteria bacterium]
MMGSKIQFKRPDGSSCAGYLSAPNRDDWCTPAAADGLEATLKACGANYELYRYDANHGFCNDRSAVNYDAASCNLAFERLQLFLTKHLG